MPADCDSGLLVVGSLNMDLVGQAPRIPAPGETVLGGELLHFPGGKGGNQAVAAARLGVPVAFAGAVGSDDHGRTMREGLGQDAIDCSRLRSVPGASGAALITVSAAGENAITVLPGANRQAALPDPQDAMHGVRALLLQLELPLDVVTAWALHARRLSVPVLLNAAPATPLPDALWPALDMLLVNRSELAVLAGTRDLHAGLEALRARGPRCVVVTLGEEGACVLHDGGLDRVAGHPVEVLDTTGAGDTFAGAWAALRLQGCTLSQALSGANLAAALACRHAGARQGMPTRAMLAAAAPGAGLPWLADLLSHQ